MIREDFGNGIYIDWNEFDPKAGTGAALAEFYFQCADAAAELGEDALADSFWQAGAQAAAHPSS
jgi:hypothetical protein